MSSLFQALSLYICLFQHACLERLHAIFLGTRTVSGAFVACDAAPRRLETLRPLSRGETCDACSCSPREFYAYPYVSALICVYLPHHCLKRSDHGAYGFCGSAWSAGIRVRLRCRMNGDFVFPSRDHGHDSGPWKRRALNGGTCANCARRSAAACGLYPTPNRCLLRGGASKASSHLCVLHPATCAIFHCCPDHLRGGPSVLLSTLLLLSQVVLHCGCLFRAKYSVGNACWVWEPDQ